MKRRTTPTLRFSHTLDMEKVKKVEFLFKQEKSETAPEILLKTYPDNVTEKDGVFEVTLTESETTLFKSDELFYCDPKITLVSGVIPATKILDLMCSQTLWGDDNT